MKSLLASPSWPAFAVIAGGFAAAYFFGSWAAHAVWFAGIALIGHLHFQAFNPPETDLPPKYLKHLKKSKTIFIFSAILVALLVYKEAKNDQIIRALESKCDNTVRSDGYGQNYDELYWCEDMLGKIRGEPKTDF